MMGNPKLLLTSYVVWSLADSGMRTPELQKSIDYIRKHVDEAGDNAYILALAANALAAWDAKDDSTLVVLQKLDKLKAAKPEWKAISFPTGGQSLSYAHGDSLTVIPPAPCVEPVTTPGRSARLRPEGTAT